MDSYTYLNEDKIAAMTETELIEAAGELWGCDPNLRPKYLAIMKLRAKDLKFSKGFSELITSYTKQAAKVEGNSAYATAEPVTEELLDKLSVNPFHAGYWEITEDGIRRVKQNGSGINIETASTTPVVPAAVMQNLDSGIYKTELHSLYKNHLKIHLVDNGVIANKNKIIELANQGITVNSDTAGLLMRYFADIIAWNRDSLPHYKSKSRLGWAEEYFMPYDSEIKFDGEEDNRATFLAIKERGTLSQWAEFIAPLRSNLQLRLAMAASFASPLLELVHANSFIFHLWGGTGVGKTVVLMLGASIWGDPTHEGLLKTLNMTQNALMSTAGFLNHLPFFADELQTIKSNWQDYDQLIMRLTEGKDRGRNYFNKTMKTNPWRCAFLFSGEEPVTHDASGGGAKNRVIEIECTKKLIENGNAVVNFITGHYGCAGPVYIEKVKSMMKDSAITRIYQAAMADILAASNTTDKQAGSMAALLAADHIASECFFPDEPPIQISDILPYLLDAQEVDISERAYSYLVDIIAKNRIRFSENQTTECWGKIEVEGDSTVATINKTVLSDLLKDKGFSFDAVKAKWSNIGYLIKNSQDKYAHYTKVWNMKALYVKVRIAQSEENEY